MSRFPLSRRTFLRGAGTLVALPALEAMMPTRALAQTAPRPRRLLAYYVPNGIHMAAWTPEATGESYALSPILEPLARVKDRVLVLSGIANRPAQPDGPGDHAAGTGSFLTCAHVRKTEGDDIQNGISMDQVAAAELGRETAFPSLQLGAEGGGSTGGCDSGYSCAYARNISWAGPQTPLAKEANPVAAFDRLFQGRDPAASAEAVMRKHRRRMSVLDFVREDAVRLQSKLGSADRRKVDDYLTGVRELERRLERFASEPVCTGERPGAPEDFTDRIRAMSDVIVTAFTCDLTRVISFMLGNAGSNRVYSNLGIGDGHHQISHHQGDPVRHAELQRIDTWEVGELAYLLERMNAVQEGDATLLDNSIVFFSSEISDGDRHNHNDMPILLAGRAGGAIRPGRHLRYASERSMASLFIAVLQALGVQASSFGDDGTGPIGELT